MTRLAYSRLPTSDGDVEIQMPDPPKRRTAACKYIAPCFFILGFLVGYMDVLSFDKFPNNFLRSRNAKSFDIVEDSSLRPEITITPLPTTAQTITTTTTTKSLTTTAMKPSTMTTTTTTTEPIPSFELRLNNGAVFRRRKEVAHVDCTRLLKDDKEYAKEIGKRRPNLPKNSTMDMSCETIQKRILPARNPDTGFPILYARIVYMDYDFLEDLLATNYANENVFCFTIDKKASREFHERLFALEKCLPNVVIAKKEQDVDSAGHNHNEAHLDCMGAVRDRKWEYAMLLQNHDVMIKTHNEMTDILRIYGGANDIENDYCNRCISTLETNMGKLDLCPNRLRGMEMAKCKNSTITWGKGMMQMIVSRAAIDYIFDEINVRPLMKQLNDMVD